MPMQGLFAWHIIYALYRALVVFFLGSGGKRLKLAVRILMTDGQNYVYFMCVLFPEINNNKQ